jgi:hypothetical protein
LERHAELPHHDDVERRVERRSHLERHRHSPARNTEHDDILLAQVKELPGQLTAGVDTIREEHHRAIIDPSAAGR